MNKLRIALVGLGRLGTIRARAIAKFSDKAELFALCDLVEERTGQQSHLFGVEHRFTDPTQLLTLEEIDAVWISNSSDEHSRVVKEALLKRKHIFCEKPLALDLSEIEEIEQNLSSSLTFQLGFTKRFDPDYLRIKKMVAEHKIGRLVHMKLFASESLDNLDFYREFLPRSGGLIFDLGSHDIDLARWLTGSEVENVYATGGCFGSPEIEDLNDADTYFAIMKMKNGIAVELHGEKFPTSEFVREVELRGTEGVIRHRIDEGGNLSINTPEGNRIMKSGAGMNAFVDKYEKLYFEEVRSFIDSIREKKPAGAGFIDGREAVKVADAMYTSLRSGKAVQIL